MLHRYKKGVWFLKALRLMTESPACLMVKRYIESKCIRKNKKHQVYTVIMYKIALNRGNDKRLVQANGITTLARRHVALSV